MNSWLNGRGSKVTTRPVLARETPTATHGGIPDHGGRSHWCRIRGRVVDWYLRCAASHVSVRYFGRRSSALWRRRLPALTAATVQAMSAGEMAPNLSECDNSSALASTRRPAWGLVMQVPVLVLDSSLRECYRAKLARGVVRVTVWHNRGFQRKTRLDLCSKGVLYKAHRTQRRQATEMGNLHAFDSKGRGRMDRTTNPQTGWQESPRPGWPEIINAWRCWWLNHMLNLPK